MDVENRQHGGRLPDRQISTVHEYEENQIYRNFKSGENRVRFDRRKHLHTTVLKD